MKSIVNVYKQKEGGEDQYFVFLDLLEGEDIECPAFSNPSGFNYAKAELITSCEWYESGLCYSEFNMEAADEILADDAILNIHMLIASAFMENAANNKNSYDFIKEVRESVEGISKHDHLFA